MSSPSKLPEGCIEALRHTKIKVQAKGRVALFANPAQEEVKKLDVDCWLAAQSVTRADFVLTKPRIVDVIVELKGKEIAHAAEQILATHAYWKRMEGRAPKTGALIVFTRSPLSSAAHADLKKRFLTEHKIWLEMGKNSTKEYRFETFTGKDR